MARGGRRSGVPGGSYGQRTDLIANIGAPTPAPPNAAATPNPRPVYGSATPGLPTPPPALPHPAAGYAAPGPSPTGPPPGALPLSAPTEHPGEPLTAGLPTGAGPGPEALSLQSSPTQKWQTGTQAITAMAANPNASPALQTLAASLGIQF